MFAFIEGMQMYVRFLYGAISVAAANGLPCPRQTQSAALIHARKRDIPSF